MKRFASIFWLAALAAGCSNAGMGDAVRQDISARMQTVSDPLSTCYKQALEERRRLAGTMWVNFQVAPKTGKFTNVRITRTEVSNPGLETCVLEKVSTLAITQPQSTVVSVDYPILFSPEN
jgi:hypothetical protein